MGSNSSSGKGIRVYELARELGMDDTKQLMRILRGMLSPVKTASSCIPDDVVKKVRETVTPHIEQMRKEAQAKKAKVAEKTPPTPEAPKRSVRITKRATEEEKKALLERGKHKAEDPVSAEQTRKAMFRSNVPGQPFAGGPATVATPVAAAPVSETVAVAPATPAVVPAQPVENKVEAAAPVAQQPVLAEEKPAAQVSEPATAPTSQASEEDKTGNKGQAKRRPGKPNEPEADEEENDKDLVDLPKITPDEFGIAGDEVLQLSASKPPEVGISPEDAFGALHAKPVAVPITPKQRKERQQESQAVNRLVAAKRVAPTRVPPAGQRPGQPAPAGRPGWQARPGQGLNRPGQPGRPGQGFNRPGQPGQGFNRGGQGRPGQGFHGRPGMGGGYNQRGQNRPRRQPSHAAPVAPVSKVVDIPEVISLSELASRICRPASELIKYLISLGKMVTINQALSYDEASEIATAFGCEVGAMADENIPLELIEDEDEGHLQTRPPVVTVLGHVDHGKTSLLDAIRKTSVTASEDGGITQKIGAYTVKYKDKNSGVERPITFIDTPGHEAFTHMRARGASITDIAVLVVAANDGVMPQTIEAINHAKAAGVPILVAINKIDLPEANAERVMQQLTEYGLLAEEWGGETIMAQVSSKKRIGLDNLLEMILLVADMQELKANPERRAQGTIIEGWLDKGLGPVATVLVQNGTLHPGDTIVVGKAWGRIRNLLNENGERIRLAGPSIPAEIVGLSDVPNAGDHLQAVEDERMAKQVSEARAARERHTRINSGTKQTLENLFTEMKEGVAKDLTLLVKADGHGSMEALNQSLNKLTTNEVAVKIVHSGVGAISESDVMLASASGAIIIGFNVRPDGVVKRLADQEQVDIRAYKVIYHVIEDIKKAMSGLLSPDIEEVDMGRVEVRQIFKTSKAGKVCGCYVAEGKVTRDALVRLLRDSKVIWEGSVDTLKRFKDDAREVQAGFECGLTLTNYHDVHEGDIIECYQKVEHEREL